MGKLADFTALLDKVNREHETQQQTAAAIQKVMYELERRERAVLDKEAQLKSKETNLEQALSPKYHQMKQDAIRTANEVYAAQQQLTKDEQDLKLREDNLKENAKFVLAGLETSGKLVNRMDEQLKELDAALRKVSFVQTSNVPLIEKAFIDGAADEAIKTSGFLKDFMAKHQQIEKDNK